jgi:formylglycine-generating enzyme required for sulfatase activity
MSGNVSEWCQDKYGRYTAESQTDPQGAPSGSYHVYRGGSYDDGSSMCRVSCRSFMASHEHIGLRLAK